MPLIIPRIKKTKIRRRHGRTRHVPSPNHSKAKVLYLAYYDIQNFSLEELTHPIMTFKRRETAEIYIQNRNFEFQTLMLASKNAQQSFALDSLKAIFNDDYCITVSDLCLAGDYFFEEYQKNISEVTSEEKKEELFWHTLWRHINPFRITTIQHVTGEYT